MKLTLHEQKILDLTKRYPSIIYDINKRHEIAKKYGFKEKTIRNRIADLKKYGLINEQSEQIEKISDAYNVNKDIDLLYYGKILGRWRKFITISVISVTFSSVIISLILPKTFSASAVIMPPSSENGSNLLSNTMGIPFSSIMPVTQMIDESMNFIAILKSRTVMENAIDRFQLIDYYNADNIEEALESLRDDIAIIQDDEGTIRITMNVKTGWFHKNEDELFARNNSAEIAKFFVENLDKVNKFLKTEKASFQREFIEKRYRQNIEDLNKAEDILRDFQEENGIVSLPEQTAAGIQVAAEIKLKLLINEIQLGVLYNTLGPDHLEVKRIQLETDQLSIKLNEMGIVSDDISLEVPIDFNYEAKYQKINQGKLFPLFSDVPYLGMKYLRLSREVEMQNTLFTLITQLYEEAKIKEAKDTPTIQVLDYPRIPNEKVAPKRVLIVILTFFLSFIFCLFYVFFSEHLNDLKNHNL